MDSAAFWGVLKLRGLNFFSGVPDSTFGEAYNFMVRDPEIRYVPAVREDVALGVASAAYFAGGLGGVMMQNSGIGNIINPLTSFSLMYKIPALLVVGWRGYGRSAQRRAGALDNGGENPGDFRPAGSALPGHGA